MEHVQSIVNVGLEHFHSIVEGDWSTSGLGAKYGISEDAFPLTDIFTPIALSCGYLVVTLALNPTDNKKKHKKNFFWKALLIFYNIAMTWFSYRVFAAVFPILHEQWQKGGSLAQVICEVSKSNWDVVGFNGWLFYLSKFVEFHDTVQILAGSRKVIFLHYYHHAGAAMMMWGALITRSPSILIFMVLNSFIHTGMYLYYLVTSLGLRVPNPVKSLVTTSQIVQFLMGTYLVFGLFTEPGCLDPGQRVATSFTLMYVLILLGLFLQFFYNSFIASGKKEKPKKKTA